MSVIPSRLHLDGVVEHYDGRPVLPGITLTVAPGSVVCLIGPSGCGKSTLLRIAAGLVRPTEGRVLLDATDITGRPGQVAYMAQRDLLLPWRSVAENVALGPEVQGIPPRQAREEARELLQQVGLGDVADADPRTLSGGMRQRAAVTRTMAQNRGLVLLDEPFGLLDHITRAAVHEWVLGLWQAFPVTVLCVTHDTREAVLLADRVLVMDADGRLAHDVRIPLARPRRQAEQGSPEFVDLERDLRRRLVA